MRSEWLTAIVGEIFKLRVPEAHPESCPQSIRPMPVLLGGNYSAFAGTRDDLAGICRLQCTSFEQRMTENRKVLVHY